MSIDHCQKLPQETLLNILSFLPKSDLQTLCYVNKSFKDLAEDYSLWYSDDQLSDNNRTYKAINVEKANHFINLMNRVFNLNLKKGSVFPAPKIETAFAVKEYVEKNMEIEKKFIELIRDDKFDDFQILYKKGHRINLEMLKKVFESIEYPWSLKFQSFLSKLKKANINSKECEKCISALNQTINAATSVEYF